MTERQRNILRVRNLSCPVAEVCRAQREALGFPVLEDPGQRVVPGPSAPAGG